MSRKRGHLSSYLSYAARSFLEGYLFSTFGDKKDHQVLPFHYLLNLGLNFKRAINMCTKDAVILAW